MKTFILLLIISIPTLCFSQWKGVYRSPDQESVIEVINKDTIIAATYEKGHIYRSTNGGKNWSFYQTIFTTSWFNDLDFPTNLVGYACGGTAFGRHKNLIAKTIDGGLTWDSITSNDFLGYSFKTIHFINADTGFVAKESKDMLITVDGGQNFTNILTDGAVTDIVSKPNQELLIACKRYTKSNTTIYSIAKSINLGNTWSIVYKDTMNGGNGTNHRTINKLFFVNNNIGYAVGGNGLFLKTTNGGATWTSSFIKPYSNLTGLYFISPNIGYINNAGGIYRSEDAGINWTVQKMNPLSIIRQIQFANDTIGYALGNDGILKTSNGGVVLSVNEISKVSNFQIYPNPVNDVLCINGLNGLSVESIQLFDIHGKILREFPTTNRELNVLDFPRGIYIVKIQTDKYQVSKKVIVK